MGKRGPKGIDFRVQLACTYVPCPPEQEAAFWRAMDVTWGEAYRRVIAKRQARKAEQADQNGNEAGGGDAPDAE